MDVELAQHNEPTSLEEVPAKKGKFRLRSKSFFLTYPRCLLTKEEGMALLKSKLDGKPIRGIVVAAELHEDGTPHLHAYICLQDTLETMNSRFWDLGVYHGDYQKARDINAVVKYIKKDGNILEEGDVSWAEKVDAKKEHRRALGKELIEGTKSLPEAVQENPSLLFGLRHLKQDLDTYRQLAVKPLETPDVRGIWIYGAPGVGKSYKVRKEEPDLFIKAQNKWWDGYTGQRAVLIDDFDKPGCCLSHYLKIWADRYQLSGEIKGGQVPLAYERFYITSNYHPRELFPETEDSQLAAAIERRFKIIHMLDRDLDLDGYYPEEPRLAKRKTVFEENN